MLNPHLRRDGGRPDINVRHSKGHWQIFGDRIGRNWQMDPDLASERSSDRRKAPVTLPKLRFMEQCEGVNTSLFLLKKLQETK